MVGGCVGRMPAFNRDRAADLAVGSGQPWMAGMKLKTYRAPSMADALTVVKKDLGRDAVILHTRTIKTGGILGFKRRTLVEVTASDEAPAAMRRSGFGSRAGSEEPRAAEPSVRPLVSAGAAASSYARAAGLREPIAPAKAAVVPPVQAAPLPPATSPQVAVEAREPVPADPAATVMTVRSRRGGLAVEVGMGSPSRVPAAPREVDDPARIRRDLADIKLLVAQVLQSTPAGVVGGGSGGCNGGAGGELGCGRMPEALFKHYLRLLEAQVSRDIADRLVGRVRDELNAGELADETIVRTAVLRHLADLIPTADAAPIGRAAGSKRPFVVALVGPTGVGKTTTIAKLAATYRLRQGRSVALITADTYRIAAVDQLRTYASIIGLPLRVVLTPGEMGAAVDALSNHDVVLIDTAGRSQRNTERLAELSEFLAAAGPTETHLVLSTAASQDVLVNAAEAFAMLRPNRVILTKLDEAVNFGVVVNVMQRLESRLSFVTTGQEVPDHIEPGHAERLARMILEPDVGALAAAASESGEVGL